MEAPFLYKDTSRIANILNLVKEAIRDINPIFTAYNQLELKTIDGEELQILLTSPKTFFLNLLTNGETLKVGSLTLDPEKVYELSPRPDGVDSLVNIIENENRKDHFRLYHVAQIKNIDIVNNELVINEDYKKSVESENTYHADTPEKKRAYDLLIKITQDLSELRQSAVNIDNLPTDFLEHMVKRGDDPMTYKPNFVAIAHKF